MSYMYCLNILYVYVIQALHCMIIIQVYYLQNFVRKQLNKHNIVAKYFRIIYTQFLDIFWLFLDSYVLILLFHIPYNKYIAIPMNNHTPKRIHAADFSPANM